MLLVEGMGVKRASPPGACRRAAPGRRRAGKRKQTRGVRSALGGWPAGPWDIGHWKGAEGERADTWQACLGALSLTGGTEATTDLVVSDGANGLESALEHPRSGVAPQRCMFHTIKPKLLPTGFLEIEVTIETGGDHKESHFQCKALRGDRMNRLR